MTGRERRLSPRKICAVPLRYRVVSNGAAQHEDYGAVSYLARGRLATAPALSTMVQGEAVNLSERGVFFLTPERLREGEPLEMYFTLPRELTGRSPEAVRCSARVVHVEERPDQRGLTGVGAVVERFEPLASARNWSN